MKFPNQTILIIIAILVFALLSFVFFGIYSELRIGNRNYVRFQDSLMVRDRTQAEALNHPKTREERIKSTFHSAGLELDSVLIGDSSRNFHLAKYYEYSSEIDSIIFNDPARYDDVHTDWTERMDSIARTKHLYGK